MSDDKDIWGISKDRYKKTTWSERREELLWSAVTLSGLFIAVWLLRGNDSVPLNQLRWAIGIFLVSLFTIAWIKINNKS